MNEGTAQGLSVLVVILIITAFIGHLRETNEIKESFHEEVVSLEIEGEDFQSLKEIPDANREEPNNPQPQAAAQASTGQNEPNDADFVNEMMKEIWLGQRKDAGS